MPRKSQGLRVFHRKTRNGCLKCKKRRVKCDLKLPSCSNCIRRMEFCEYPLVVDERTMQLEFQSVNELAISLVLTRTNGPAAYLEALRLQRVRHEAMLPSMGIPMTSKQAEQTLAVVFHYSWFTSQEQRLWIRNLAKIAPKHLYVQHCLLATVNLGGFRKCIIDTSTSEAAYEHQLIASRLFREGPSTIDHQSWMAVLFFCVCMLVFQLFTQSLCDDSDFDPMETLHVARSTLPLVMGCCSFLKQSAMWALTVQRCQQQTIPPDPRLQDALRDLENTIENCLDAKSYGKDDFYPKVIVNSMADLNEWIVLTNAHPQRWDHYCSWPAKVKPEYLELLAYGDDLALLIFIYWASIMHSSLKPFVKSWTKRAALWAVSRLKADFTQSLAWPMTVFFGSCEHLQQAFHRHSSQRVWRLKERM